MNCTKNNNKQLHIQKWITSTTQPTKVLQHWKKSWKYHINAINTIATTPIIETKMKNIEEYVQYNIFKCKVQYNY